VINEARCCINSKLIRTGFIQLCIAPLSDGWSARKSSVFLLQRLNVIKLPNVRNKPMILLGKHFLASLIFVRKVRAYPSESPFRCSTLG
jgi:hypothetical protein